MFLKLTNYLRKGWERGMYLFLTLPVTFLAQQRIVL